MKESKSILVLIVEDEKDLRLNLEDILQFNGFEVKSAENGLEGYKMAVEFEPDIIISDVRMPEMDGLELLKKLQDNPITKTIPFIFLTAKVESEDIRTGMALGADDYITKPFKIEDVINTINSRLLKKQAQIELIGDFKNTVVRNASHNLRTPLVSIIGFADILLGEYDQMNKQEILNFVLKIKRAGEVLKDDIDKFMLYSEYVAGSDSFVDLNEIYLANNKKIIAKLLRKGLEYNREKDLTIEINEFKTNVKPDLLEFMLNELVDNALKNSIEGTPIKISVECKDSCNVFKVTDYGAGINTSKVENVNSFTLQNFSKKNTYGLGLSLTIIKKIVKLYNGNIDIISEKDRETTIKIEIPFNIKINNKAG